MTIDVSIVSFAQAPNVRETHGTTNGVEMLVPTMKEALERTGLSKKDIGFWCSGSSDYLAGRAFSFIAAVDAIGAFPPIHESHVEADAAWALYEAWVKIRTGEVDTALVYGFGKSSAGLLRRVLALQLDPYTVGPLWPDSVSIAGLQARLGLDGGLWTERDMADVAVRSRGANPDAQVYEQVTADELLARPFFADPLRRHDCAPVTDGAAVVVLASAERAGDLCERPTRIASIQHRVESAHLGARDLTTSPSTVAAAKAAGADGITRRSSCGRRSGSVTRSWSTPPAGHWRVIPCSRPDSPASARRRPGSDPGNARSRTRPPDPRSSRTSCAYWRLTDGEETRRRPRRRPDPSPQQAARRDHGRIVPRGHRPRAR
jgi:acetyl-CoA acetyltransferase